MYDVEEITDNVNLKGRTFSVIHNMEFYTVNVDGDKMKLMEEVEEPEIVIGALSAVEGYLSE